MTNINVDELYEEVIEPWSKLLAYKKLKRHIDVKPSAEKVWYENCLNNGNCKHLVEEK